MTFVGPLLGVAVAAWSPTAGFVVNAATFAVSGLVIATIRGIPDRSKQVRPSRSGPARLGPISAFVDGIGAVRSIAGLAPVVASIGVMYFVRGAEMVLHVYVVRSQLGADVEGSLYVVAAAVALVGAAALWPLVAIGRVAVVRQRALAPTVDALSGLAIFEGTSGPSLERIAARLVRRDRPRRGASADSDCFDGRADQVVADPG